MLKSINNNKLGEQLTHMNASSRTLLIIVHILIEGCSESGQMILQQHCNDQCQLSHYLQSSHLNRNHHWTFDTVSISI